MSHNRLIQSRWSSPEVAKRICLFGSPLVGRSEIITRTAEELALSPETCLGIEVPLSIRLIRGAGFAVAAAVGALHAPQEWRRVLDWSNRLLIVLDPQRPMLGITNALLEEFSVELERPRLRAVQVTKIDLAENMDTSNCFRPSEVPAVYGLVGLPAFFSSIRRPETLSAGVRYLLDAKT